MITTFVERWLPDTHTFHLSWSEATITLQDMAYHLGLHAHGNPVGDASVTSIPRMDNPETLRKYARCYIMLPIRGYLMTDKSNNLVHLRWFPLLEDFGRCLALSWGSAMLAWTYQLVGLQQQSRDQHKARVLRWRVSIDKLRFDERSYDDPALQALYPHWFVEEEEWGTWMSVIPVSLFASMLCSFTRLLTSTVRGEDVWWPDRHHDWYDGWCSRFDPGHRISILHMFDTRPTQEYY
ncbi:hypothetical protein Ahy_A03g016121 [Arachis hypogaea]|uniref:Aminotransferase-like plant mobile domain-containing protein n=1 Tax=Arachis hypogaea TaxID=3818 RepID=A0A445E2D7_ARAHY|nr:hypothetical protein Ahy_A03g016121 [Arachis hypogaea]